MLSTQCLLCIYLLAVKYAACTRHYSEGLKLAGLWLEQQQCVDQFAKVQDSNGFCVGRERQAAERFFNRLPGRIGFLASFSGG